VSTEFDLVIIGGGPAGYVGAIRAAQLGMNVALIERDRLGGVCLNWGCIPTKALLAAAESYRWLQHEADQWGIIADHIHHDWSQVLCRARAVAGNLNLGVGALLKKKKVTVIAGAARILGSVGDQHRIEVTDSDNQITLVNAGKILIATGSTPRPLPDVPFDGQRIISYRQALTLEDQPRRLLVVGAGAIGTEFAYFFNAFGSQVTVVEVLDRLLAAEDHEVSRAVARAFRKQGIEVHVGTKLANITRSDQSVRVTLQPADPDKRGQGSELEADIVLVAIGVQACFDGLLDDSVQLQTEQGHIVVDPTSYQTSVEGIFAVGDVIGPPYLAHVASDEAVACIEFMNDLKPHGINYESIPACTFCVPQVASLGKTEQALKQQGLSKGEDYVVGKFPLSASGKAQALGQTEGFVKLIADAGSKQLLGAHLVGHNVSELLAELGLVAKMGGSIDDVIDTMHAHPTLAEAVHEAALGAAGRMRHF